MTSPASPQAAKPSRRFLGCGCSAWLWAALALIAITVVAGLLADAPARDDAQPAAVPTFTDTPVATDTPPPTETPVPTDTPPPTETPIPTDTPPPAVEQRAAPVVPIIPAAPAADLSDCPCDGDTLNCGDFAAFDAQSCYLRCLELTGRDVHRLDRDGDGNACEWK